MVHTTIDDAPLAAATPRRGALRRAWVQIHLWLGLTLGVLGAAIGLSGSVLVFDHAIDAKLNPQRYAVSGATPALPYADYAQRATEAVGEGARVLNIRLPQDDASPVEAFVRARGGTTGARRVYLDPPTGRVLDAPASGGLIGFAHDIHGSLKLRDWSGREIVGVVGIAMLVSSLSGIYLWWPRRRFTASDFGFRPRLALSRNLHYVFGLYSALVLALLSFTGIVISFPDAGRAAVALFGPLSPSPRGVQAGEGGGRALAPDAVASIAGAQYPGATVTGIGFPSGPRGAYRVALRETGDDSERGMTAVFVDPRTGSVLRRIDKSTQTRGDAFLALQRPLHEGVTLGLAGRVIFCIAGLLPALFVVTGTIMWLRTRRRSR